VGDIGSVELRAVNETVRAERSACGRYLGRVFVTSHLMSTSFNERVTCLLQVVARLTGRLRGPSL
jgi:hypothetical protein